MSSPTEPSTAAAAATILPPRAVRLTRRLTRTVGVATAGSVLLLGAPGGADVGPATSSSFGAHPAGSAELALSAAAADHGWRDRPGKRRIVGYTVRRGDTATRLAVRFHAWTSELRAMNHLGRGGHLYVGQRIRVPIVTAAVPRRAKARPPRTAQRRTQTRPAGRRFDKPWRGIYASRVKVRRVIIRTARRHGMDPRSMLAISWQESGWQQRRRSWAGAIGAMQIMPGTGTWMSWYAGRRLNIYALRDNVTAGVLLFKLLRRQEGWRRSVAAYYQGLGAVQRHGLYGETRTYYRSVRAIYRRLDRGWNPA